MISSINNPCLNNSGPQSSSLLTLEDSSDSFSLRPQGKHDYPNHVYNESTEECSKHIKTTMHLKASYQTLWNWRLDWQPSSCACLVSIISEQYNEVNIVKSFHQIPMPMPQSNPMAGSWQCCNMFGSFVIYPVLCQSLYRICIHSLQKLFPSEGDFSSARPWKVTCSIQQCKDIDSYRRIRRHLWRFWRL